MLAPADVHRASLTLAAAEDSYHRNGDTQDTRDLGYTAERHAEIAQVHADAIVAIHARDVALASIARSQAAALEQAKTELAASNARLAAEQAETNDAERRAAAATALLMHIATVRKQQRDVIITLSGSVLFASGRSDLLPDARTRLHQVANVLSQDSNQNQIVVRGFTDSLGSADRNQELSQRRAESVSNFLASQGVPGDHLKSEGRGMSEPVADNTTPEGRANNRRVEIVIQSEGATSSRSGMR
jgi:outer membrane protein OmpA-like peptidoglycan-associated protein